MTAYCDISRQYATDVVAGVIPACKWVRLACQRQLDDLANGVEGYTFDTEKAERVCKFINLLPHIKGEWAGRPIDLEPWQVFILTTVFGWVDADGYRRFKSVYIEVPRKNAKSTLSSGVALYLLTADGEAGAEVYSAATTRDQARIVWDDAKRMVDRCPGIRKNLGVKTAAHTVFVENTASTFRALSRDQGGNLDGLNVHGAIIDELHAHKTREVVDVIDTATGARRQPLVWKITTAGFNRAGICYEERAYLAKVLNGVQVDQEIFGIIYTIDDDDDWGDETSWEKANPNWGVSVNPEDIRRKSRKAKEMSKATNNFLTKHLNVWVNADTAWLNMQKWDALADPSLNIDDFVGDDCWLAVDLASKTDIAAKIQLFRRRQGDDWHYYVFGRYWLPEGTIEQPQNDHYQGWLRDGLLVETPGDVIDLDWVEGEILEDCKRFNPIECPYDPFQATQMATHLMNEGVPVVEVGANVKNFSEPMKELESLVLSGRIHHTGCPVLQWMVSNVVCHVDAKENIYPRKEFPENKIDGVVALIMALNRALLRQETGSLSDYLNSEPVIL